MVHYNGFSYKKPKGIPHKFDESKLQAFIDDYEALKTSCGEDESILLPQPQHSRLKLPMGGVLETTGNRSRLNIIGVLNLSDIGATIVSDYESINNGRFFCKLRDGYPIKPQDPYHLR
ncbi:PilZ domain-containing protein [Vibrio crassostreae]|uniref:Winged helix-turn helix domain-containing protein n=1 Tax=Vibrio crassostreae TaxID=246167 RepID=A0A822MQG0_9VIBR|nr:hypothetical protein EDB52_1291 [Vibrio crassostreae]TCN00138.1 hypothetical protein EDB35_14512 [Vibrio crassostreae]TCT41964.1 hypothetical protein EDB39_13512 [Vibrio crassostreae]TCT45658.1 hypothetical protein EDB42_12912 [Vibrio crassostreae]TCT47615.1 hypothetical protein EDB40_1341 [Vibrio crassostreae]